MSPEVLTKCFAYLTSLRLANGPTTAADMEATGEAWLFALDDMTDDQLRAAVKGHIRNPERGKWWPTPADLLAALGATAPEDPAEAAWNRMIERFQNPRYRATDGTGRWDMTGALDAREQAALREIGGSVVVAQANEFQRKDLRARFVRKLRDGGTVLQLVRTAGGGE